MDKKSLEIIPDEAIMNIKVSGTYYKRLQALFIYLSGKKDMKEFLLEYESLLKLKEPKTEYQIHLQTVLSIIVEIEREAKENKLTEKKEFTINES